MTPGSAHERVLGLLARDEPVILDGGNATELERAHLAGDLRNALDTGLWGTSALYRAPARRARRPPQLRRRGRRRADHQHLGRARCGRGRGRRRALRRARAAATGWTSRASALRLARQAVEEAGRTGEVAIAFSVNGDVATEERRRTLELLLRALAEDPPDIVFLETMSLVRDGLTDATVESALATGLPVWLSFRRCRHGVCGVYGQHWGGPEGDLFGRAAKRFEELGAGALLVNCLPPEHVEGMLPWLRDFTDLPLGAYPNLGYYSDAGWRFDERVGPGRVRRAGTPLARPGRPDRRRLLRHDAGPHRGVAPVPSRGRSPGGTAARPLPLEDEPGPDAVAQPWTDAEGRVVYPVPFPEIIREPDVFQPTSGSLTVWKALWQHRIGEGEALPRRRLRLRPAVDPARPERRRPRPRGRHPAPGGGQHARQRVPQRRRRPRHRRRRRHLHATSRRSATRSWSRASTRCPSTRSSSTTGHRPLDYWGRNLVDHFLELLPRLLAAGGVAYLMQLSILSQLRTAELAARGGIERARASTTASSRWTPIFQEHREQIERVERLSDAYHLELGGQDVMVVYLLELAVAD